MKDIRQAFERVLKKLKNEPHQRMIVILLAVGVLLYLVSSMLLPKNEEQTIASSSVTQLREEELLQQQLEECLRRVKGVGKVQVLLSLDQQKSTVYQVDGSRSSSESSETVQENTVVVSGEGLVKTVYAPVYRGAVVVCEGADRASIVQAVKAAVSSLTDLRSDQITVMKMQ